MDEYAESQFKARVARRAEQLNMNVRAVYSDSGLSRDLKRTSIGHRTIDQIERLARNLGWTFPQIMGFSNRIDVGISHLAYHGAGAMLKRMPPWSRTEDNWIDAHATLYDILVARRDEGRLPEDNAERARILSEYVDILVRACETRPEPTRPPLSPEEIDAWVVPRAPAEANG